MAAHASSEKRGKRRRDDEDSIQGGGSISGVQRVHFQRRMGQSDAVEPTARQRALRHRAREGEEDGCLESRVTRPRTHRSPRHGKSVLGEETDLGGQGSSAGAALAVKEQQEVVTGGRAERKKAKRGGERSSAPCRFGRAEGGGRARERGEPRLCLHVLDARAHRWSEWQGGMGGCAAQAARADVAATGRSATRGDSFEDATHLAEECDFTKSVWNQICTWQGEETAAAEAGVGAPEPRRDSAGWELGCAGRGGGQGGSAARWGEQGEDVIDAVGRQHREEWRVVEGSWEVVWRTDSTVGGLHGLPRQPFPVAAAQLLPRWLPPAPSFSPGGGDVGGRAAPPPDSGLPHRPAALPTAELRSKGREKEEEGGREGRGRRG
uniref:Uncharacterized protein n=1 Tax=Oryza sativa subsp. japonica TaxID=39947 RepID=Q69M65_ORYSJ|nr:hypothetical protein [Oryza sativa Japonica Group]